MVRLGRWRTAATLAVLLGGTGLTVYAGQASPGTASVVGRFLPGADGRGNGLRGIAERLAMLGGTLEIGRGDGAGFRLSATLPLTTRTLVVDQ